MAFASSISRSSARPGGTLLLDLVLLVVGGGALSNHSTMAISNAQGGLTGNGVFKSLELRPWVTDPGKATLYPSNYLFYPLYGVLCRLLDVLGVFAGDPRRQMTILNAASCALSFGIIYLLIRNLTGLRVVALLAALFHLASNFVMFLAIINEDIMPSYTVLLAAMALGAIWLAKPTAPRVLAVSVLFSLAWLMEWRLMFPTLPAMLVALWVCEPHWQRRLGWIALFLAGMVATAAVVAWAWQGHPGAVGTFDLMWTGKAVRSVWAGFTWAKVGYMWDGMVGYLLGAGVATIPGIPGWDIWRWVATVWMLAVAFFALPFLWRHWDDPRSRALSAIFGVTFVAGQVFNLYSQPQDPQMQLNVMGWLTVGWAVVLVAVLERRRYGRRGLAALAGLTVALFAYNVWSLAPLRGLDSAWEGAIQRMERESDPDRTVWLMHDFDWAMVYGSLYWGYNDPGVAGLGPAPQKEPRFKWIGFTGQVLRHPDWSDEQLVDDLRGQIDRALDLGYDVLVIRLWDMTPYQLEVATGMVASSARIQALRRMMREDYVATQAFIDTVAGAVDRLKKRPGR